MREIAVILKMIVVAIIIAGTLWLVNVEIDFLIPKLSWLHHEVGLSGGAVQDFMVVVGFVLGSIITIASLAVTFLAGLVMGLAVFKSNYNLNEG